MAGSGPGRHRAAEVTALPIETGTGFTDQQESVLGTRGIGVRASWTNRADTFNTGFTPFFFGLALFVGSIIAWMLFTPLQARPIARGLDSLRVVGW